jgi:hypothetical protein
MIKDVLRLRSKNFPELKKPRFNYAAQLSISPEQVDLATACCIHYGLHPGMLVCYIKGEYAGESRDAEPILREVSPHISCEDATHIKHILTQGCPSYIDFKEESKNKLAVIQKGNQHTFLQYPEVTAKAMNKEEKNSHVLPLRYWTVHFSPWLQVIPQGICKKYNKFHVIFDLSTQTSPDEAVLNHVTTTNLEAYIDFGRAKTNLFINIYNWQVSHPDKIIYLALADITACFRFPRISADVTKAFGIMAEDYYYFSTSHVFGSYTSASSWEPLR